MWEAGGEGGWLLLFSFFCFLKEVELAGAGPNSVFYLFSTYTKVIFFSFLEDWGRFQKKSTLQLCFFLFSRCKSTEMLKDDLLAAKEDVSGRQLPFPSWAAPQTRWKKGGN